MISNELKQKIKNIYRPEYEQELSRQSKYKTSRGTYELRAMFGGAGIYLAAAITFSILLPTAFLPCLCIAVVGAGSVFVYNHKKGIKIEKELNKETQDLLEKDIDSGVLFQRYKNEVLPQRLTEKTKAIKNARHEFNKVQKSLRDQKKSLIAESQELQKETQPIKQIKIKALG